MKKFCLSAVLAIALSPAVFANTLTNLKPASCSNSNECSVSGVSLTGSLTATAEGRKADLKLFGAGLRAKVFVVSVPVYVAQFYAAEPSKLSRNEKILDSISTQSAVAMTLTFRRDVDANQIQTAFQEAFEVNGVDVTSNQIAALLDAALKSSVAKNGKVMTFVGEKFEDGSTAVTFEGTQGNPITIHGDKDFVRQVMTLWLGNPEEKELVKLKSDLLRDRKLN